MINCILMFLILYADSFISDLSHYFPKLHQLLIVSAQLLKFINSDVARSIRVQDLKYFLNLFLLKHEVTLLKQHLKFSHIQSSRAVCVKLFENFLYSKISLSLCLIKTVLIGHLRRITLLKPV